jgi:hypothetical protein
MMLFFGILALDLSPDDFWGNIVKHAGVAKLADALDLGSSVERRVGSSPTFRTSAKEKTSDLSEVFLFNFSYAIAGFKRRRNSTEPAATKHRTAAVIQAMK